MSPSSVEFLAKISNTTTFWKLLYCFLYIKISKYQILPNKTEHRLKDQKMKDDPGLDHGFFALKTFRIDLIDFFSFWEGQALCSDYFYNLNP